MMDGAVDVVNVVDVVVRKLILTKIDDEDDVLHEKI